MNLAKQSSLNLLVCLLLVCVNWCAYANHPDYAARKISPDLIKNADVVYRTHSTNFKVIDKGNAIKKVKYAVTILNQNGKKYGYNYTAYNKLHKLNKFSGKIYDATGKLIRKLKKSDIETGNTTAFDKGSYGDTHFQKASLVHGRFPYTVEYEYEIKHNGLLFYPVIKLQGGEQVAVEQAELNIILTKPELTLRYHTEHTELEPTVKKTKQGTHYQWIMKDLKPIETEAFTKTTPIPTIHTAPAEFEIEGYEGDLSSWESFGTFYHRLNRGRDKLSKNTIAELKKLIADTDSQREKVKRIYQYLQSKTRYVSVQLGIGGWQTFNAAYVEKNGFGDCKALTNFMYSALKAVGIASHPTLVNAGSNEADILPDFPSNQFNHIILCVPLSKDTVWLECTSQSQPFGYLGSFTDDRYVLMVKPKGSKLIRTPKSKAADNAYYNTTQLQLNADGTAKAAVHLQTTGRQQALYRELATEHTARDQEEFLQEYLPIASFDLDNYTFSEISKDKPSIHLDMDLTVRSYTSKAGSSLLFCPNLLNRLSSPPPKMKERSQKVVIQNAYLDVDSVHIQLPENYQLKKENLPESKNLTSEFGEYTSNYELLADSALLYTRRLQINSVELPAESYQELSEFMLSVYKLDRQHILLEPL